MERPKNKEEYRRQGIGRKLVDFIAEKSGDRLYLQVAMNLSSVDTIEREFRAFEGIADNYPKYVLTLDEIWTENRAGIKQKFLPDFLLEEL